MLYELATLRIGIGTAPKVVEGIDAYLKDGAAKGRLLGCWTSEIGALNEVYVLRGFADESELATERRRTQMSANPFHCGDALAEMVLDSYAPFPFLPPVETGAFGSVYEIRSYRMKTGGLASTLERWEAAVPARVKLSPLVIAMYTLDGPARFTHIWPYADLNARLATRSEAVKQGIWPPKGGAAWLAEMRSTIALPTAISPLR